MIFSNVKIVLCIIFSTVLLGCVVQNGPLLEKSASKQGDMGYKVTDSGLRYKALRSVQSGKSPSATSTVMVHYEGRLLNGNIFDSSYQRGKPSTFPLNHVIKGWTEGLQLMHESEKYEFYIPADLAYGANGTSGIPPNSPLIFTVELIKVY